MKTLYTGLITFGAALLLGGCQPTSHSTAAGKASNTAQQQTFTAPINWDANWQFFRADQELTLAQAQTHNDWQKVNLPHTAKIEPRVVNDQFQGDAWYKKTISYQTGWQDKRILIDFEGAMNAAEVWLNGEKITQHQGGYLPFSADLTESLKPGDNTLLVRLDNRDNKITGPKPMASLDFNMYGGLYRHVWLRVENSVHITDAVNASKVASGGIFVRYPNVTDSQASVAIETHVANTENTQKTVQVRQSLWKGDTLITQADQTLTIAPRQEQSAAVNLTVNDPALWSPASPNLYQLTTEIFDGDTLLDREQTAIGIREFRVEAGALYINGKQTFLRGVNRHQEYPYVGYALSDNANYRDAALIKAAGFDYVRLSHYPHSTSFMQAADELGLVLIDAVLGWQYYSDDPAFKDHVVQTCRDLIRRDRNHPSVLAWECSLNESWMPEPFIDRLQAAVHEEYPGEQVYSAGWQSYGYDIYLQARQHRLEHYEKPTKPYIVSEYGDWEYYAMNAGLNQDTWGDLLQAERSSRQLLSDGEVRLQQQAANVTEAHDDNFNTPAVADGYWVMFDYNRGYADDLEASGLMSLERLPKFSYYVYQSQRDADDYAGPLSSGYNVFIANYWQPDSSLSFNVYSNADEVALTLNGKVLARQKPSEAYPNLAHPPFHFELDKFAPGTLEAIAYADGKEVARHRVTTPGKPTRLTLAADLAGKKASHDDLVFVHAQLLDSNGQPTRVNGSQVRFQVNGPAELVGPTTTHTEAGIASALLKITGDPTKVGVSASNESVGSEQRDDLF